MNFYEKKQRTQDSQDHAGDQKVDYVHLAQFMAALCSDKQAQRPLMLDLRHAGGFTDVFLIVTVQNSRQAASLTSFLKEMTKKIWGIRPLSISGLDTGTWVLMDFGGLFVHIFQEPTRELFKLEQLWAKAKYLELDETGFSAEVRTAIAQTRHQQET